MIRKVLVIFGLVVFLLVSCTSIETVRYDLEAPAFETDTDVKIVLIADLHSTIYGERQSVLVDKIRDERPDLILMVGDIIDDKRPVNGTRLLLEGIRDIAPIFYVTGNHEYKLRYFWEMMAMLRSFGVVILSDTYTTVSVKRNTIVIAGLNDPYKRKYQNPQYRQEAVMEKAFRGLDELAGYKILMAHRPELIKLYLQYAFDLVVSGHAHGGQVRLPPLIKNGLYAPHQGIFPKYTGGIYVHDDVVHIVSRGLAVNRPFAPRIFNNPELTVIVLKGN